MFISRIYEGWGLKVPESLHGKDEAGSSFQGPRLLLIFYVWFANKQGHAQYAKWRFLTHRNGSNGDPFWSREEEGEQTWSMSHSTTLECYGRKSPLVG